MKNGRLDEGTFQPVWSLQDLTDSSSYFLNQRWNFWENFPPVENQQPDLRPGSAVRSPQSARSAFLFRRNPPDCWTEIKHLAATLLNRQPNGGERTAILRSLFSCLLLWFDWANRTSPPSPHPNPRSLDPIRVCGGTLPSTFCSS